MSWSALLFGKASVHCIDHGYVLDVNFIPYSMYNSHFCSRVFTFFVIFFFQMYGTALPSKLRLYYIVYDTVLHVRVLIVV